MGFRVYVLSFRVHGLALRVQVHTGFDIYRGLLGYPGVSKDIQGYSPP